MVFMQLSFTPMTQGSTKVPSSSPGQVDFLAGQVTLKAYDVITCTMGKDPRKSSSN